jgi:GrpB-like predicted nucleotidyltransferase (UPF0157 family)
MSEATATPAGRIAELDREPITIVPYDDRWPLLFAAEQARLGTSLPPGLCSRIDHIGSTAVPGCPAKPVVDIQVAVTSLERVRREAVPIMDQLGYEFIWRPTMGERVPHYAWFIRRDGHGRRLFHVHMVEPDEATADRLLFRDHLRAHPQSVAVYNALKQRLALEHPTDRAAYTRSKSAFINDVLQRARAAAGLLG